jgi:hypothetical protein
LIERPSTEKCSSHESSQPLMAPDHAQEPVPVESGPTAAAQMGRGGHIAQAVTAGIREIVRVPSGIARGARRSQKNGCSAMRPCLARLDIRVDNEVAGRIKIYCTTRRRRAPRVGEGGYAAFAFRLRIAFLVPGQKRGWDHGWHMIRRNKRQLYKTMSHGERGSAE